VLTQLTLLLLVPFSWGRFFVAALLYTAGTLSTLYLLFHPRSQILVANRFSVPPSGGPAGDQPTVALTFDDGPSASPTRRLLDILEEKQVKATFFLIGANIAQNREVTQRIQAEGHQIGNHTYSHPELFCFLSPRRLFREIAEGQRVIREVTGISPRYFRSPAGLRHPLLSLYLKRVGVEYISWEIRPFDTRPLRPEVMLLRITRKVRPGAIILLQCGAREQVAAMLEMLPQLIDQLKAKRFHFVLV